MGMAPIRDRLLILGSGEIAVGTWPIIPQPSWLIRGTAANELAEGNRPSARAANGVTPPTNTQEAAYVDRVSNAK